ncbi:ATP phosphoribosyltransferase [Marinithermus hydrothermalis]|uniref:ATP phosphoribosyltransferase n=1 Tax=Marinithermus hydrothermalis (strain DSM 14884 / JCM 11576 / T1) TaxID=869210 RepID=F2NLS2_MARHT|nr:ATP phosphoribosyltransferase [Marinithermus hydrothermalis]AEB10902.1 ATP phosphoribosyltransferase [Marinithermus hydrothermalis DSM 14884]
MIRGKYRLVVALPKGRMFAEAVRALEAAGLELPEMQGTRVLMHGIEGGVAVLELRNADVPVYVELGIADVGVVGKDVLLEAGRDVYEPVDLGFGACRLSLIRHPEARGPVRRIATKYPRFTQAWLRERGWVADVVKLSGNIELAALTGLADAVVDVVQTGATLRAAGLVEVEVLARSSARLVVNRAALKLKREVLRPLIRRLREQARTR